jgi:hypothetical protein
LEKATASLGVSTCCQAFLARHTCTLAIIKDV